MPGATVYRVSGCSLMLAAVLWAAAMSLTPLLPATTVAVAATEVGPLPILGSVLALLACVLGVAAMIGLYRHFAGTEREGWALLALACNLVGNVAGAVGWMTLAVGKPALVYVARTSSAPAAYDPAMVGLAAAYGGILVANALLNWVCLLPLGIALLGERAWPRWAAWGAVGVALLECAAPVLFLGHALRIRLAFLPGFAFLAALGYVVMRFPRSPRAARA